MCLDEGRGSKPADEPTVHRRVQTLFDACKETFSASFSNRSLERVRTLLDSKNCEHIFSWHLEFFHVPLKMLRSNISKAFLKFEKQQYKPLPLNQLSSMDTRRMIHDAIKPIDVGLDESLASQNDRGLGFFGRMGERSGRHLSMVSRWSPPITYLHIFENKDFSIGIFCLPTSAVIPLHNHPGMTVLSKLLYGSMHVKAYDWVNQNDIAQQPRLAKVVVDKVISAPCEPSVLYPTSGGNIHSFTAVTPCAVLDILAPPYSTQDGRHCTYYREIPYSGSQSNKDEKNGDGKESVDSVWLGEFQPPDDFVVEGAPYRGPRVIS